MSVTYQLNLDTPATLGHADEMPPWLADFDVSDEAIEREFNVIDAMAASGDFFVTLATRLDTIAQGLAQDSAEQIEIEHLVKMMFYLQDNYGISYKGRRSR
jgi:hypothetical protein